MKYLITLVLIICSVLASAQNPKTRILFVLDASNSMYSKMDQSTRITVAKRILGRLIDSMESMQDVELALRVYGHQHEVREQNCKDTRLIVEFSPNNHQKIKESLKDIRPRGTTLIAYTLEQAAYDFPKDPNVRNVIILITDGLEECEGDPCAVSTALQKQGVIVRPFIIGLGLTDAFKLQFECVGRFFDAETESDFKDVLNVVISQAINNTTVQVNLLDKHGKPTETDVNMTFYDSKTGKELHNYIHTLDYRGNPDTIYLDPSYVYDMKVHTIPPIWKKDIVINPGKHNVIAVDAPQGSLNLIVDGATKYPDLQALILDPETGDIVNIQSFNTTEKYIIGTYDVLILSLPTIEQDNLRIDQSTITKLQVAQPGKLNLITRKKMIVSIFMHKEGKMVLLKNVEMSGVQDITIMQPGTYTIVYREASIKETIKTKEKTFEISSGQVTQIELK